MPATKNAMTRYTLIDRMLANRHRAYSIQDITDALNEKLPEFGQKPVSKRCVEKDINYLEYDSPFDVEIEEYCIDASDRHDRPYRKRCIRYADPTFSIFKPKLTDDEKNVLSTALDTLGSFDGLDNFEWLDDLKKRLDLEEHEPIIFISKNLLTNSTLIARMFSTIMQRKNIRLKYHTFQCSEKKTVFISPHILKEYNNRWFLIASALDSGKILTFPLDRIDDFSIVEINDFIPTPNSLHERYEEIIGLTFNADNPLQEIVFWVSDKSLDYVTTKPIHESQKIIRGEKELFLRTSYTHLKGGKFFKIECRENYELIRELCSFGPELIVISPSNILKTIIRRIEQMSNYYKAYNNESI